MNKIKHKLKYYLDPWWAKLIVLIVVCMIAVLWCAVWVYTGWRAENSELARWPRTTSGALHNILPDWMRNVKPLYYYGWRTTHISTYSADMKLGKFQYIETLVLRSQHPPVIPDIQLVPNLKSVTIHPEHSVKVSNLIYSRENKGFLLQTYFLYPELVNCVSNIDNLKVINVDNEFNYDHGYQIDALEVDPDHPYKVYENAKIADSKKTIMDIKDLTSLRGVVAFRVYNQHITNNTMISLSQMSNLESFTLGESTYENQSMHLLANFSKLKMMTLYSIQIDLKTVHYIKQIPKLERIELIDVRGPSDALAALKQYQQQLVVKYNKK